MLPDRAIPRTTPRSASAFDPTSRPGGRSQRGSYLVEFALVLAVLIPVTFTVGEFGRVSLCDQALARATHRAALAAGRNAGDCQSTAREAFEGDAVALWLFDADDNGRLGFVTGAVPDAASGQEVRLDIAADDGNVANGVTFDQALCGVAGSWIRVEASVPIRSRWGLGDMVRRHAAWSLNQSPRT